MSCTTQVSDSSRRQYTRNWWAKKRQDDPTYEMFLSAKKRAKRKGLEFTIDKADVVIPTHCPITGLEIVINKGRCGKNSPSLDRIDNSKGYIPGNVAVISNHANHCKSNLSVEEINRLCRYVNGEL